MVNFYALLLSYFPLIQIGSINLESFSIFLVLSVIAIALVVIYFISANYKKNYSFKSNELIKQISLLQKSNESLREELEANKKEINVLLLKLSEVENERNQLKKENEKLVNENKRLTDEIQNLKTNDDIIVEFFMKEKSSD